MSLYTANDTYDENETKPKARPPAVERPAWDRTKPWTLLKMLDKHTTTELCEVVNDRAAVIADWSSSETQRRLLHQMPSGWAPYIVRDPAQHGISHPQRPCYKPSTRTEGPRT